MDIGPASYDTDTALDHAPKKHLCVRPRALQREIWPYGRTAGFAWLVSGAQAGGCSYQGPNLANEYLGLQEVQPVNR